MIRRTPARCSFHMQMWVLRFALCAKALWYGNWNLAWGSISGVSMDELTW